VSEFRAGLHYKVSLPAKGQVRVLSVVTPNGPVGNNTTARWAVEGRIGNELLGGLVHEMHVPAILPELELPPVTPVVAAAARGQAAPLAAAAAAPSGGGGRWKAWAAGGVAVALTVVMIIVVIVARRRRHADARG
jgi:hypothetical protein